MSFLAIGVAWYRFGRPRYYLGRRIGTWWSPVALYGGSSCPKGAGFVCTAVLEKITLGWTIPIEGWSNNLEYALDRPSRAYSELFGLYVRLEHIATLPGVFIRKPFAYQIGV